MKASRRFVALSVCFLMVFGLFGLVSFASVPMVAASPGVWNRYGVVLEATETWETDGGLYSMVYEPFVIYEGNPKILTGESNVFKMWYAGGRYSPCIGYAESADGKNWTKYSGNPILSGYNRPTVVKYGGTYYLYVTESGRANVDLYTSTDGVDFSLDTNNTFSKGTGWEGSDLGNICVWVEDNWKMLYEAKGTVWKIGLATSSDGKTWVKSGSNPVISKTGSRGGPYVEKIGSYYYIWIHGATSGYLPTDMYRMRSSDLTTWEDYPADSVFFRVTTDEGVGTSVGQVADPHLLENNQKTYLYYSASPDGGNGNQRIKLANAQMGFSTLITTTEDAGGGISPLLVISPENGPVGTHVTFTGSGFTPNAEVNIYYLVGPEWILKIASTDSGGGFTSSPHDIDNLHGSDIQFIASDQSTWTWSNVVHFVVEDISLPHIDIIPTGGSTNVIIEITGTLFTPNCSVSIFNQGIRFALKVADSGGTFTTFFTIPANTPLGPSQFIAYDHVSDLFSNEVFYTVTSQQAISPILSISPTAGKENISITFTGSSFTPSALVQIATRDSTGLIVTIAAPYTDDTGAFEITMNPWSVLGIAGGGAYLNFHALDVATGIMSNEVIFTRTAVLPTEGPAGSLVDLFLPFTGDVATAGYLVGTLFFVAPLTIIGLAVVAAAKARQYAGMTVFGFFLLSVFICVMTSLFPWWFLVAIIAIISLVFARGWFGRE